jgi:hypothetical protein
VASGWVSSDVNLRFEVNCKAVGEIDRDLHGLGSLIRDLAEFVDVGDGGLNEWAFFDGCELLPPWNHSQMSNNLIGVHFKFRNE